jgi:hypothetical protein
LVIGQKLGGTPVKILISILAITLAAGCFEPPRKEKVRSPGEDRSAASAPNAPDCRQYYEDIYPKLVIVVLIDKSASRDRIPINEVTSDLAALLRLMPPTTLIEIRWLAAESYSQDQLAAWGQIPRIELPVPKPDNPFDLAKLREYRLQRSRHVDSKLCLERAVERAVADIEALEAVEPAPRTDVFGGLVRAAETFATFRPETIRVLVLYSDLAGNVGKPPTGPINGLSEAAVLVRTARALGTREEIAVIETEFEALLTSLGAALVEFSSMRVIPWHVTLNSAGLRPLDAEDGPGDERVAGGQRNASRLGLQPTCSRAARSVSADSKKLLIS